MNVVKYPQLPLTVFIEDLCNNEFLKSLLGVILNFLFILIFHSFLPISKGELKIDLNNQLKVYQQQQITKKMQFRYFDVDVFKKGTMRIKFRDLGLLKRFNIYGCQHKGWLPPSYGKKSYKDMNAEEKQVVDEYEGQQEYEKVYNNRENYILDVGQRMLLTDGG